MKKVVIFALVVVALFGFLIATQQNTKTDINKVDKDKIILADANIGNPIGDHVFGNTNAKVLIVEYGDYQCPACASHSKKVIELVKSFPDGDVALVFRHYPLPNHTSAKAAAGAAEAAGLQGKFWEMHQRLYEEYLVWGSDVNKRGEYFEKYARELGLDESKFKADLSSSQIKQKIDFDTALGNAHELTGTPTVVVNGEKVDSTVFSDTTKFKELINSKLSN